MPKKATYLAQLNKPKLTKISQIRLFLAKTNQIFVEKQDTNWAGGSIRQEVGMGRKSPWASGRFTVLQNRIFPITSKELA